MMIAVPASSVRWGRSWASSVPNSLYNASASSSGERGPFDGDDAYIELGMFRVQGTGSFICTYPRPPPATTSDLKSIHIKK